MAAAPQVRMLQQVEAAAAGRSWIEGYFIPRGFTIVYADSLGTAGSDGCRRSSPATNRSRWPR